MKQFIYKISFMLLAALTVISIGMVTFADETATKDQCKMDETVAEMIRKQLPESETAILERRDIYKQSMAGKRITDLPVLRIYSDVYWELSGLSLESKILESEAIENKNSSKYYRIFDSRPYKVALFESDSGEVSLGAVDDYNSAVPTYILDIQNLSETVILDRNECKLEGIHCFDGEGSHQGTIVYLETDKGIYVKYYENAFSDALLFTEDEFRKDASAYYEYITSDEYNYDSNGQGLSGNEEGFAAFVLNNRVKGDIEKQDDSSSAFINCLIGGIATVLLIAVGVWFIVRRKAVQRRKAAMTAGENNCNHKD